MTVHQASSFPTPGLCFGVKQDGSTHILRTTGWQGPDGGTVPRARAARLDIYLFSFPFFLPF